MANVTFAITENIAVIGNGTKGWQKEVNMVSWNGGEAKLDIRDWAPDHDKMGKGIVLTAEEGRALMNALEAHFAGDPTPDAVAVEPAPAAAKTVDIGAPLVSTPALEFTPEQLAIIERARKLMQGDN